MSCRHEIRFSGLCGVCGEPLPTTPSWHQGDPDYTAANQDTDTVHILHGSLDLQVSKAEAERVETAVMNRLLAAKRLSLVIDLDQTLLHATMDGQVESWLVDENNPFHAYCDDIYRIELPIDNQQQVGGSRLYQTNQQPQQQSQIYFVKLRPKVREFLERANELFELHVYTMGSRPYARACCKLLDPTGRLFHDRILSRDDAGLKGADNVHKKSLKRIFPHSSKMVLVLDDRGDVWRWAGNVVIIRPFLFYSQSHDNNADINMRYAAAAPRADAVVEGAVEDEELTKAWNRLSFLHSQFFVGDSVCTVDTCQDVALINERLRCSVLTGIRLCFTGVFPRFDDCKPDIVSFAESFGAVVTEDVNECNIVIVGRPGTDKHRSAVRFGIICVSVDWLLESCWSWNRLDPLLFPVDTTTDDLEYEQESSEEEFVEAAPKRHKHDDTDLLEWLDNELDGSEMSGDSDDIYGHSDDDDDGDGDTNNELR